MKIRVRFLLKLAKNAELILRLAQVTMVLVLLASGALGTPTQPKTTNVNTNFNNNYNSNLDLLFITLVNYLMQVLIALQNSGHLPGGETDMMAEFPELSQFPSVQSLFLDPRLAQHDPNEDEQHEDQELTDLKKELASLLPSAESVNINFNKNENANFNLLYDYLINYLVDYEQSKVAVSSGKKASSSVRTSERKDAPVTISNAVPKQVEDTLEVKEAKRVFQQAFEEAKTRVTRLIDSPSVQLMR